MNIQSINKQEIERIKHLIELNAPNLKDEFIADIDLVKTNPKQYWDSFLLPKSYAPTTGPYFERTKLIKSMQNYYKDTQLKLFNS